MHNILIRQMATIFRVPFYYVLLRRIVRWIPAAKTDRHHRCRRCKWIYAEDAIGIPMNVNVFEQTVPNPAKPFFTIFSWNWKLNFSTLFDRKTHTDLPIDRMHSISIFFFFNFPAILIDLFSARSINIIFIFQFNAFIVVWPVFVFICYFLHLLCHASIVILLLFSIVFSVQRVSHAPQFAPPSHLRSIRFESKMQHRHAIKLND